MSPYRTVNPATGDEVHTFATLTNEEVDASIGRAHTAFAGWSATTIEHRTAVLSAIADRYEKRLEELAETVTQEMGKALVQARFELQIVIDIYRYYASDEVVESLRNESIVPRGGGSAYIRRDPLGVLLGIMPWNFPHYQVARFAAPNLLLGNTVVLKHASICGRSALAIEDLFQEAGLPADVYINLFVDHSQIEQVIADDRLRGVALTGSDAAGAAVAAVAGKYVKKVALELGGSDPFIVLESADVQRAAQDAVMGRVQNSGQTCVASKRFIVVDAVYDEFLTAFVEGMKQVQFGDPMLPESMMGPLSSERGRADLHEQVRDAVSKGAQVLVGGEIPDGPGYFYPATVLTGVTPDARAFREELFGPVAVVHRVADEDEAIRMANDSPYGLSSSIYTTDLDHAHELAGRIEAGMVFINSISMTSPELPFGGVKGSGSGRELGLLGLEEFSNRKLVRSVDA